MPDRQGPQYAFVSAVNGVPGSGAAVTIPSISDLGPDQMSLPFLEGQPTVSGDDASVLIPEGARGGGGVAPEQMMAFVPGWQTDADRTYEGEEAGAFVPGDEWVPNFTYSPGEAYFPGLSAVAGWKSDESGRDDLGTDDHPVQTVVTPNIEQFMDRVGMESLPEGAERVESGTSIDTQGGTVFAGPSDLLFPEDAFDERQFPDDVFDQGVALPLNGEPFGLGVLATPTASVGGEQANPLVDAETGELLQRDATNRLLADTGITDADDAEWLAAPERMDVEAAPTATTLLGTETDLETFGGVLSGEDGPWAAVLFVGRVTDEDHVVAVAGVTRPAGTVEGGRTLVDGSGWGMDRGLELLPRAAEFAAETMGQLERA
jgi:hypothetical protein